MIVSEFLEECHGEKGKHRHDYLVRYEFHDSSHCTRCANNDECNCDNDVGGNCFIYGMCLQARDE